MREFNLDHLRTLLAVADLGSFAGAAVALNLAQPTVSLHLRELESRLQSRLLERGRQGVSVTPAGAILIDYARKLLALADEATQALRDHRDGVQSVVRIGASAGLIAHHMPGLLQEVAAHHPDIKVTLAVTTTAAAIDKLLSGELDLALTGPAARHGSLTMTRWRTDPVVAFLPVGWKTPRRVTPSWLHAQSLLMNEPGSALHHQTMQWFGSAGFFPRPRIALNNGEALKSLVASGYGAALLPLESAREHAPADVQCVALSPAMSRHTFLVRRKAAARSSSSAVDTVIALLLADKDT